ncbi:MAG: hypothetical protein AB7L09_01480 [Nitrospira sp.]
MDNPFPPWQNWNDGRIGRHVTQDGLHCWRVLAGDLLDPDLLLIARNNHIKHVAIAGEGWEFVSALDEIRIAACSPT